MNIIIIIALLSLANACNAFYTNNNHKCHNIVKRISKINMMMNSNENNNENNNNISKKMISSMMSVFLLSSSTIFFNPTNTIFTNVANADIRAQQKKTYFRFVPKLITGLNYYKSDLKAAVDNSDWSTIAKFFEVYVTKYNPSDPKQVDATDTYVNSKFFRPMTVFAGSFAEKSSSPKQKAMMEQEQAFESAMKELEKCATVTKGQGFFASDTPASKDKKAAKKAFEDGKNALNEFIKIANNGLMLELNKIDSI